MVYPRQPHGRAAGVGAWFSCSLTGASMSNETAIRALTALRRLDKALCICEDTKDEWQYQTRRIEKTEQQMKDEHKAWADFRAAEEELRLARWAACDLLTVEGM
jgi:hypothetical protein